MCKWVLLENYIICDDSVGCVFCDVLVECVLVGVFVVVVCDWVGCFG